MKLVKQIAFVVYVIGMLVLSVAMYFRVGVEGWGN
jgi:hypothetical protein